MVVPSSCLIIGLGQIGMGYDLELDPEKFIHTHARAFSSHPAFKLVGAVDPAAEKRFLFEKYYQCTGYDSLDNALKETKPQIIVISTPTARHAQIIENILEVSTPEVIVCEKPLAYTLDDACKIVQLCTGRTVALYVNYIRRSDPGVIEIKERIDSGKITTPIKGVVWYSKGFLHNGSHFFNLLEYWLGPFHDAILLDKGRSINDFDSEPHVQVTFANGTVDFIPAWEEHFPYYTVEVLSPGGRLYWGQGNHMTWQAAEPQTGQDRQKSLAAKGEQISTDMTRYQWNVADQLAKVLSGEAGSICSGTEALGTLRAMHQILEQGVYELQ